MLGVGRFYDPSQGKLFFLKGEATSLATLRRSRPYQFLDLFPPNNEVQSN